MVSWYWLIAMFVVGYLLALFEYTAGCEHTLIKSVVFIILYVPIGIYEIFFRHTVKPVQWSEGLTKWVAVSKNKVVHLCGDWYFWIDPKAKRLYQKIFFIRILNKPIDK